MNNMARLAHERVINQCRTNAFHGSGQGLDYIEVPRYEWYYSPLQKEMYQYADFVFEAHAAYTLQTALQHTHPVQF